MKNLVMPSRFVILNLYFTNIDRIKTISIFLGLWVFAMFANAQTKTITNFYRPGKIGLEDGKVVSNNTVTNATWIIEPFGGPNYAPLVRIKNAATGDYLHNETRTLSCGKIQSGWHSALWMLRPLNQGLTLIINYWTKEYLHVERGPLEISSIGSEAWNSAYWKIETVESRKFPETYKPPLTLQARNVATSLLINGALYNGNAPTLTSSMVALTNQGKYLEYTFNNIPDKYLNPQLAIANIKFRPKASIKDGVLYVHLTTEGSSININPQTYVNKKLERGFYTNRVETSITISDDFEKDAWGPLNVNSEGTLTDMSQFTVGVSKDGPNISYSLGSQYSKQIKDFSFEDKTYSNTISGVWKMGKDIIEKTAGQYSGLAELPALASGNFPIYAQAIFKARQANYIPNSVTLNFKLKTQFKEMVLVSNQGSDVQAFFEGFVFYANPKTYQGTLAYKLGEKVIDDEVLYTIILDLTPLKQ